MLALTTPPPQPAQVRSIGLRLNLSPEEKALLVQQSEAFGLTQTGYLRHLIRWVQAAQASQPVAPLLSQQPASK